MVDEALHCCQIFVGLLLQGEVKITYDKDIFTSVMLEQVVQLLRQEAKG